ncbi:MAG: M48 family metallopeptidase [Acidobacteria bacterium]|nr:M48 family metallopeptidase [Acidobacteriota bacterium]
MFDTVPAPPPVAVTPSGPTLSETFQRAYRDLRPRAPMPLFEIRFRRFTSLNTTIRLREGKLYVQLSDLLEEAPQSVLEAIAHILIAKLYRKPIERNHNDRYRRYTQSERVSRQAEQIRQQRGRKRLLTAKGHVYDLDEIFEAMNRQFFDGLLGKPVLTWSGHHAKRLLGHYDAAHNTIVISRVFDRPQVPRFAIEYLMYHEMLHLKHPVRMKGSRRCVHSREFKADEERFPDFERVKAYLKRL